MKLHGHAWGLVVLILLALTSVNSTTEDPEDTDPDNEEAGEEEDEVPLTKNVKDDLKVPGASNKDYEPPEPQGSYHFAEPFKTEADFQKRWIISQSKKEYFEESKGKYEGLWAIEEPKTMRLGYDLGLVLKSKAKHHAVSAKLDRTYEFEGKPFIVQYEVRFQNGHDCGGAYIKLLTKDKKLDLTDFRDTTGYTIMFGPDRCGHESKLHFIFRHRSPKTGVIEEKHAKKPKDSIDHIFSDKKTHLFTLVIEPDNTFEIYLDQKLVNTGSLLQDVEPAVNPPKEIIDRTDRRPMDWDDREKIPDPEAKKPDDWDENEPEMIPDENAEKPIGWLDNEPDLIPDPDAEKPKDWDEDMDGEWEAPMINNPKCESAPGCGVWKRPSVKNPKYKGKFKPPMVANPNYAGKWKPRMIPNPDFFEDLNPYKMMAIEAIGLELWSMTDDIIFDNFIITDDKAVADKYAEDSWNMKRAEEFGGPSGGFFQSLLDAADERKWLYAVYLVVVLLPVVALSIWLCPTKGPIKPADLAARQKKTDEPSPDDVSEPVTEVSEAKEGEEDKKEEDAVDDAAGGGDAPGSPSKTTKKKSKSDLEAEEASEQANEADGEEENEEVTSTSNANPDVRTSPRKRQSKPRKD